MPNIDEIFYELINEAKDGKVILDGEPFNIKFNTIIEDDRTYFKDDSYQSLIIKNKDKFLELLEEYLKLEKQLDRRHVFIINDEEKNHIKMLMTFLLVNATFTDFENPIQYLRKRIDFLKDQTFNNYKEISIPMDDTLYNCNLHINNELDSIYAETPYKMSFYLEKDGEKYYLPSINYGISNNKCYIYSMMNKKEDKNKETKFGKKINRLLFKLNNEVLDTESQEFIDYKNGESEYYPENITDVSLSFVYTLSLFIQMLSNKGIKDIELIPYLPVRYNSRSLASRGIEDDERNDRIQRNATDKLIRTVRRVSHHLQGVNITSTPYLEDENMHIKLDKDIISNNEILESRKLL